MTVRVHININGYEQVIEHPAGRYCERNTDGDMQVLDKDATQVALYPPNGFTRIEVDQDDEPSDDASRWSSASDHAAHPEHLFGQAGAGRPGETLAQQVARLAEFICDNIDGEPSQSQGAIDTAIRIMSERLGADVDPLAPGRLVRVEGSVTPWQVRDRRYELRKENDPATMLVVLTPYDDERSITTPRQRETYTWQTQEVSVPDAAEQTAAAVDWQMTAHLRSDEGRRLRAERDQLQRELEETRAELARRGSDWDQRSAEGRAQVERLVNENQGMREERHRLLQELEEAHGDADRYATVITTLEQERDRWRTRFESMQGKRNRARDHAVRNERERDDALAELAEVRGERDALLQEVEELRQVEELRECTTVDTPGDDVEVRAETLVPRSVQVGDRLAIEDGDGKGVMGRIESWTAAPGGLPFVVVVGADR